VSIRPIELLAQIKSGRAPTIVDVRSRQEYLAGHVPGAVHIPFWAAASRVSKIHTPAHDPVIVYCGHGPRAWIAGALLGLRGFRHLVYLEGHWAGWRQQGLRQEAGAGHGSV
jgi:rhodanese-related sulfurtransferase